MFRNKWRHPKRAFWLLLFCLLASISALGHAEDAPLRVLLLIGSSDTASLNRAYADAALLLQKQGGPAVTFETITNEEIAGVPEDIRRLQQADLVLADTMHTVISRWLRKNADFERTKVYTLRTRVGMESRIKSDPLITAYYSLPSRSNMKNLLLYALNKGMGVKIEASAPEAIPAQGYFHPAAEKPFEKYDEYLAWYRAQGRYREGASWIGVAEYNSNIRSGESEPVCTAVVAALEKRGLNVLPVFFLSNSEGATELLMEKDGKPRIDLLCAFAFRFVASKPEQSSGAFAKLNIPVINLMRRNYGTLDEWRGSSNGLSPVEITWQLCGPEINGLIEPSLVGGKVETRDEQGRRQFESQPVTENIDALAERAAAWSSLRRKTNAQKKIAIIYYNHSPGKQNVGAAYLNVFRSVRAILASMKEDGYNVQGEVPDENGIKELVLKYGRNIGSWADGELDALRAGGRTVEIPLAQYRQWYDRLDGDFRKAVEKQWGRPEDGTIMCKDGKLILPCVNLGKVILIPQPSRGWTDDPLKTYHDPALWPHHQYIAFYLWLRFGFQADAIIHLGTHGTHEWLPGKQSGLSQSCPPEALLGNLPNLYPYIMDNIGEGLQARRRGKGVVIDHLTPAFVRAGQYNDTRDFSALIADYDAAVASNPQLAQEKLVRIADAAAKLGVDKELGIKRIAAEDMERLEHYLNDIAATSIPDGLHDFGVTIPEDKTKEFVRLIQERNTVLKPEEIDGNLRACGKAEMDSLLRALSGGFVAPGMGNDPIRNPAALPTGKDFYGFDPDKTPSPDAYKLGMRMADEMVEKYRKEKGEYPQKVALVVWSVETQRNEGSQIATALHLMGMRPVWDRNGKVTGTESVLAAHLGRPRINVHIQASGLFRDCFPGVIKLLDQAAREAGKLRDTENFIARHTERVQAALQKEGMSEADAREYAGVRVFSTGPGGYSGRVQEMVPNSGFWEKDDEIADVFIRQVSYGYGANLWGKPLPRAYVQSLQDVNIAMHTRSSSLFKGLDNDDVFGDLGGVAMAVRRVTGKAPEVMIARQDNPQASGVESLAQFLGTEMRSRYLNPRWIEGMKKEGYAGAREMSKFVENFWGFQVTTPGSVNSEQWQQAFDVYVTDKYQLNLREFFRKENAWAFQSIAGRMLEAVRKDYWNAPEEVRKTLAKEYALDVIERGAACCDHTCNNPLLSQLVVSLISLPGMLSPAQVEQFKAAMMKSTGKTIEQATEKRAQVREKLAQAAKQQELVPDNLPATKPDQKVEGYEMEKQSNEKPPFASSGAPWMVMVFALIAAGLFLVGWLRYKHE